MYRKKPEYDERSDSDDENPSKVLRLKFPFFKKNEYAQRDEDYYKELGDADFINSDDELMELDDSSFVCIIFKLLIIRFTLEIIIIWYYDWFAVLKKKT